VELTSEEVAEKPESREPVDPKISNYLDYIVADVSRLFQEPVNAEWVHHKVMQL